MTTFLTTGRCLIDGNPLSSFLATEALGPLFCDEHTTGELLTRGVAGGLRNAAFLHTPVGDIAPVLQHRVCTAILFRSNFEASVFQLNDEGNWSVASADTASAVFYVWESGRHPQSK
jgi:hypothetical protein